MDTGHYNCRDYYVSPHFAPTTIAKTITARSPLLFRHESFDELEQRSRSPLKMSRFPFLRLPLEIRQQIYLLLLPRTIEHSKPNPLASHALNFSAVKKRSARGMVVPQSDPGYSRAAHIVWQRGNIRLLSVCRQMHNECAELLYGNSTFLLFITYTGISFRFNWLLLSGMAPQRKYDFLELLPKKYMALVKRVVVNIDHVDSYTGMIKFNVSGKGLTHGLRKQVQRLVNVLQSPQMVDPKEEHTIDNGLAGRQVAARRLAKVNIRVSNGNAVLDQIKSEIVRKREGGIRVNEDLEEMLEPFADLRGVREVEVAGAVTDSFAKSLRSSMMDTNPADTTATVTRSLLDLDLHPSLDPTSELRMNEHEI
ncbi:hypothetical protein Slin15195_G044050 [Septoria linicola]|uniref:DUF7730 domain-containing protein n=1 Tax=Septoria linicola TaxID=215465 RepID=A0A9Q9AUS9_9PEZI|nr:hypothetical protein Slin14017_G047570 [Septoria linicola]USW51086.1 hypothetical protein Slin15195_G044050 [Septoria linicola]